MTPLISKPWPEKKKKTFIARLDRLLETIERTGKNQPVQIVMQRDGETKLL